MDNLSTDPKVLEDEAISREITRLQGIGDLQTNEWVKDARPQNGWNFEAFTAALESRRSSVPQFAGAQPKAMAEGGWFDQIKSILADEEGFYTKAYHGVNSTHRAAQGSDIFVRPGHQSSEEVSIGYGWNMQRKDTAAVWSSQLGMSEAEIDDVKNGVRTITKAQAERLRDYAVMEVNNAIDKALPGFPLRDHQRAALNSIGYNMGFAGMRKTGILDALTSGKPDAEAAKMILAIPSNPGRRKAEAALFMGAKAQQFFAQK